MKTTIHENGGVKIAEVEFEGIGINSMQDALDLVANVQTPAPKKIILHRENIHPDFFELRTGLAGEILQKFSQYGIACAIVGDFSNITSEAFKALIIESNRGRQTYFVPTIQAAIEKLSV
ncbi:MAG: DUF4180 domain-containing protein [Candidatus Doudnabacteria bacterium]|nr:DUF4180 domain-containing protein [Candidatus Doudnabacteria bacterium]